MFFNDAELFLLSSKIAQYIKTNFLILSVISKEQKEYIICLLHL